MRCHVLIIDVYLMLYLIVLLQWNKVTVMAFVTEKPCSDMFKMEEIIWLWIVTWIVRSGVASREMNDVTMY